MKKEVNIVITRSEELITVRNQFGAEWKYLIKDGANLGVSSSSAVGFVAAQMIASTISAIFYHVDANKLSFRLTVDAVDI